MTDPETRAKRAAAEAAVAEIEDGMLVGIGTGSTVACAISALGHRVAEGLRVRAVVTSFASGRAAATAGIAVERFAPLAAVDLAIDGIDQIDPAFRAIKGAGGAMLREKVIAAAATRMIAIGDGSKAVQRLGGVPVPVEVIDMAQGFVASRIAALGGEPSARRDYRTDQGYPVLDCRFAALDDPERLAAQLQAIPGVLGHGLFLDEIDALYIGTADGVTRTERTR